MREFKLYINNYTKVRKIGQSWSETTLRAILSIPDNYLVSLKKLKSGVWSFSYGAKIAYIVEIYE